MQLIRKIITVLAIILCGILIVDGLYEVLAKGSRDWGKILIGAFFLLAVMSGVGELFKSA